MKSLDWSKNSILKGANKFQGDACPKCGGFMYYKISKKCARCHSRKHAMIKPDPVSTDRRRAIEDHQNRDIVNAPTN